MQELNIFEVEEVSGGVTGNDGGCTENPKVPSTPIIKFGDKDDQ